MDEPKEYIELEVTPVLPDTVSSLKEEIKPLIENILSEAGKSNLLSDGQIKVNIEKTFPTDAIIILGLTLMSKIAVETYKELILPKLMKHFKVQRRNLQKKKHN